jgi:hypothetical protein
LIPIWLAALDVTLELEYPWVIGESLAGSFQFSQRATIITVSTIKMPGTRKVCFARIWTEAKRCLNRCVRPS